MLVSTYRETAFRVTAIMVRAWAHLRLFLLLVFCRNLVEWNCFWSSNNSIYGLHLTVGVRTHLGG
jgi:hypothetical protein